MNKYILVIILAITACSHSNTKIPEGRWTGALTPMNHPEMENPMAYNASYQADSLIISLVGPGAEPAPAINPRIEGDTLFFAFKEPEDLVLLDCALAKKETGNFSGRCIDASGKWAKFTMIPPSGR